MHGDICGVIILSPKVSACKLIGIAFLQANVLINARGYPALCDFGRARFRFDSDQEGQVEDGHLSGGGRVRYLAPELLTDAEFVTTEATDCYAFAMTILELGTLAHPFSNIRNDLAVVSAVIRRRRPPYPRCMRKLSASATRRLWGLMSEMWKQMPGDRPGMAEVVEYLSVNGFEE